MIDLLSKCVTKENVKANEPMSKHTTFRVGGPADYFVIPKTVEELKAVIELCKKQDVPYYIIGNGSNLLVDDLGVRGVIIQLANNFSDFRLEQDILIVKSGAMLAKIANFLAEQELSGFEFAAGIPGTLGGAVTMNAGAYGGEIKNVILSAVVMDNDGNIITLTKEELQLGYRTSIISKNDYIVLEVAMQFEHGNKEEIKELIKDYNQRRRDKQPLEYPSAGSTFKRPEGHFAGKLIQDAGLKGYRVGGAMVSEKHSGFVINVGGATSNDVLTLVNDVIRTVQEKFGVSLELEVKCIK